MTGRPADSLVSIPARGRIKVRTGAETIAAAEKMRARLTQIDLPILIMHGSDDEGAAVSGSKQPAEKASAKDVTLKLYDGLYHEVFNEPERDIVLGDLVDWLEART
jgi:acylglycerol lipase